MSKKRLSRPGLRQRATAAQRVCLFNLGCYKNLVDAEVMLGHVVSAGAPICEDPKEADVLIVNTCCFIRPATRESSNAIRSALALKKAGRLRKVIVTGCMAQKYGSGLLSRFPGVDAVVPLSLRDNIAAVCAASPIPTPACRGKHPDHLSRFSKTAQVPCPGGPTAVPPFRKGGRGGISGRLQQGANPTQSPFGRGGRIETPAERATFFSAVEESDPARISQPGSATEETLGPPDDSGRFRLTLPHVAYLRISEGCDNRCSYCVVPSIRGPHRSKPASAILKEARELVRNGARELILIAQDTAAYGKDTHGASQTHRLLESITSIGRLRWIRLLYAHPANISAELIKSIAATAKVVRYLDMPIQHASDRILRLMRRRTTAKELRNMVDRLRDRVPGIALRTSVIVGFPGETAKDFDELLAFIEWARFERLGAFRYSQEAGTDAARMPGKVSDCEKKRRLDLVMALQQENSFGYHQRLIGNEIPAMVDSVYRPGTGKSSIGDRHAPLTVSCRRGRLDAGLHAPGGPKGQDCLIGRTHADAPEVDGTITIEGRNLAPGDIVRVRVTAATEYDLHGVSLKT